MRIAGVNLPDKKHIEIALTDIFGVGRSTSRRILKTLGINAQTKTANLTAEEQARLQAALKKEKIEFDLRREIHSAIARLKRIRCFRGLRLLRGLPARGQGSHNNAKTCRRGSKKRDV